VKRVARLTSTTNVNRRNCDQKRTRGKNPSIGSSSTSPSMSTYRPTDRTITHEYHQPITSLAFDPVSDILWTGSSSGAVVAYCTPQAIRGVSFPIGGGQPVQKLVAGDNYVRACGLAGQGVGSWTKGGVNKWYFRSVQPTPSLVCWVGSPTGLQYYHKDNVFFQCPQYNTRAGRSNGRSGARLPQ